MVPDPALRSLRGQTTPFVLREFIDSKKRPCILFDSGCNVDSCSICKYNIYIYVFCIILYCIRFLTNPLHFPPFGLQHLHFWMHTSEPAGSTLRPTDHRTEVALGFDGSENVVSALNWSLGSGTEGHSSRLVSGHREVREKGIKRNQQGHRGVSAMPRSSRWVWSFGCDWGCRHRTSQKEVVFETCWAAIVSRFSDSSGASTYPDSGTSSVTASHRHMGMALSLLEPSKLDDSRRRT